ncbi:unnamed protein product [Coccothraustes coccothraustes]
MALTPGRSRCPESHSLPRGPDVRAPRPCPPSWDTPVTNGGNEISRQPGQVCDGGCLRIYSASKNLVAVLDPRKTVLELSYPHWCGCVIEPSLLGLCPCGLARKRQQCNDSCC